MDLSVVVLSWNTSDLTLRALRGAVDGAGDLALQRLCVDNASTDGSAGRVRSELPDVAVIENERNLGFAAGNNRALPHLEGRYTCFLNSDAQPGRGSLAHVVQWMDHHPRAAVAVPHLVGPNGKTQRAVRPEPDPVGLLHRYTALRYTPVGLSAARAWGEMPERRVPVEVDSVTGACLVIRTDVLRSLGGFDEGYPFYWEDVDLCRRTREAGWQVWWVPDGPRVWHDGGAATAVGGGPPRRSFAQGLLRYQLKCLGPERGRAFAGAFILGTFVRALVEPARLAAGALLSPRRAGSRLRSAGSWMTFLERDALPTLALLRLPR